MATQNVYLWNSWKEDSLRMVMPCLAFLAFSQILSDQVLALFFLAILYPIDSGHAYATVFRSHIHQTSMDQSKNSKIFMICFAALLLGFTWNPTATELFVLYVTAFHHVRQFQGMHSIYERMNGSAQKMSQRALLFLTVFPVVLFHFRPGDIPSLLWGISLPRYPWPSIYWTGLFLWILTALLWSIRDFWNSRKNTYPSHRFISFYFPVLLHGYCFFISSNLVTTLGPLLLVHGLTYLFLIGKVKRGKISLWPIALVSCAGGLINFLFESRQGLPQGAHGVGIVFLAALLLAPQLWHYIVDGIVWKRSNQEFSDFLNSKVPPAQTST